jgi:hypothetical protein
MCIVIEYYCGIKEIGLMVTIFEGEFNGGMLVIHEIYKLRKFVNSMLPEDKYVINVPAEEKWFKCPLF